jgi:hypothetical protein
LERFFDEGISIDMVRKKIVKQALQQGFTSRSRWLLQILGLTPVIHTVFFNFYEKCPKIVKNSLFFWK